MSIWRTEVLLHDIHDVRYSPPGTPVREGDGPGAQHPDDVSQPIDGGYIHLSSSPGWYGDTGVRLSVQADTGYVEVLLARSNAQRLAEAINAWLERTDTA